MYVLMENYILRNQHNLGSWFFPFEHFSHGHFLVGILSLVFWALAIYALFKFISTGYKTWKHHRHSKFRFSASVFAAFSAFLLFTSVANAACPVGFAPPGRIYHPDDNTHSLIVFENGLEKLILEPSFSGNATDYGLVLPLPSKPKITEAPEKLFQELEDLTAPFRSRVEAHTLSVSRGGVRVIEHKDVGDFKTTTLTADSSTALIQWLDENNYRYNPTDKDNFEYYAQQGEYFFVAMKVNMEKARVDSRGFLKGKLKPIEFSFSTDRPMLPLRSMAGDTGQMRFTLYTLASDPYYIPGVEIFYSKKVSFKDLKTAPSLLKYNALGQWLVRNEARFDPKEIGQDLFLERGNNNLVVESFRNTKRVNSHLLAANSGIIEGRIGQLVYLDEPTTPSGSFPLLMLMRIVGIIILAGFGFWGFTEWKRSQQNQNTLPMAEASQTTELVARHTHIGFLKTRNLLAGLVSAIATIVLAYVGVWLVRNASQELWRLDEAIVILILMAIGLVFLLFILGPAIYTAAKHGWRAFVSVLMAELLIIVLFVVLRLGFASWTDLFLI